MRAGQVESQVVNGINELRLRSSITLKGPVFIIGTHEYTRLAPARAPADDLATKENDALFLSVFLRVYATGCRSTQTTL